MPVTDEGMQHQKSTSPSGEPSSALTSSSSPKTGMRRLFNRRSISNSKRPARTSAAEPQPTTSASTPASSRSANVPSACVYENGAGGALTTSATALPEGGPAQAEISPAARFASSADPLPSKSIESAQGRRGGDLAEDAVRDVSSPPPSILASANASTSGLASRRPSAAGLQLQTFNLPDPGITFSPAPDSRDSPTPMAGSPKARNRQAAMLHAVNSAESSSSRAEEATSATSGISSGRTPRRLIHRIAASTDNGGSSSHEANTGTNGVNPRSPHPFRALAGSRSRHHVGIGRPVRSGTFIPAPGQVIEERRVSLPGAEPVVPSFHPAAPIALRAPNESQPLTSPLADPVDIEAGSEEVAPNGARAHTLRLQRPQIKIRCITWNHGNSVPKGDLEVLLGRVGEYVPPEPGWDESGDEDETENAPSEAGAKDEQVAEKKAPKSKGKGVAGQESIPRKDRIPPLVADDAHPYHVIVIAGQECPWGDGKRLAAGVALAGELSDLARSKNRAIPKEKDREKEEKEREKKERREEKEREKREEKERLKREKDAAKANGKELALQEDKQAGSHSGKIVDGEDTGPTTRDGGVPHSASLSEMRVQDFGAMAPSIPPSPMPATSAVDGYFESPAFSPPQSGVPMTPLAAGSFPFLGLGGGGGVKGWSEMCEAWLCHGPVAQLSAIKGTPASLAQLANSSSTATPNPMSETSTEIEPSVAASRTNTPIPISGSKHDVPKLKLRTDALSVGGGKSAPEDGKHKQALSPSTPLDGPALGAAGGSPAKKSALAAAAGLATSHALAVPHSISRNNSSSRLAPTSFGSVADLPSPGLLSPSEFGLIREPSPPEQKTKIEEQEPPTLQTQEQSSSHHRHLISRFGQHHDGTPRTLGPYELVMKERCYMMYMAVYVFRGALDRVRGVSRGHVKSGLLAGRVGNKGGVGISLKLGLTRLLFVNAHLAAHEGKVAERIANVEKIKRELKVDTFLPETESQDEDITARFDHCFWMGDLNFRVDITRKHADWLLMQKRYDQALEFD
ncbi:dnase i-like protein [Ceraceosorus bombacis]|uniref:Dnase i-like protein n=1 Tax=Ceraceosorus bombacis TaxID=401625 RepID=A0A0P1B813_9BASI|nr:dnase i-like protein [Ceraceosorus bombacis]